MMLLLTALEPGEGQFFCRPNHGSIAESPLGRGPGLLIGGTGCRPRDIITDSKVSLPKLMESLL